MNLLRHKWNKIALIQSKGYFKLILTSAATLKVIEDKNNLQWMKKNKKNFKTDEDNRLDRVKSGRQVKNSFFPKIKKNWIYFLPSKIIFREAEVKWRPSTNFNLSDFFTLTFLDFNITLVEIENNYTSLFKRGFVYSSREEEKNWDFVLISFGVVLLRV